MNKKNTCRWFGQVFLWYTISKPLVINTSSSLAVIKIVSALTMFPEPPTTSWHVFFYYIVLATKKRSSFSDPRLCKLVSREVFSSNATPPEDEVGFYWSRSQALPSLPSFSLKGWREGSGFSQRPSLSNMVKARLLIGHTNLWYSYVKFTKYACFPLHNWRYECHVKRIHVTIKYSRTN